MKLTVYNTSQFNFETIGNKDGGLIFEVEQFYSDSSGFKYIAKCEQFDIIVCYTNRATFEEELHDEIMFIHFFYADLKDEECTQGAIELRDFANRCYTEFKR